MSRKEVEILLVEDSPSDQLLAREALAEVGLASRLHIVADGVEAMAFLRMEPPHLGAPRPDLILLDLNLPRKDGRQILSEIKGSARWRCIPVVVLTTSESERDIAEAYDLHANCYVAKPVNYEAFKQTIQSIRDFWFVTARLPGQKSGTDRTCGRSM